MSEKIKNAAFVIAHPASAFGAFRRRLGVAIEHMIPPSTSTWEDFPKLSLKKAHEKIKEAKQIRN